jgi:hypothetical protein
VELKDITKELNEKLYSAIDAHNDGLSCDREFLNAVVSAGRNGLITAGNLTCKDFDPKDERFAGCDKVGCETHKSKSKSKFTFELHFDTPNMVDVKRIRDKEISRMLSVMTELESNEDPSMVDILLGILAGRFYTGGSIENHVIKTMLNTLATTGNIFVAHCFECDKLVTSRNVKETVCAYDTVGHGDSHRIFKIAIKEQEQDDRLFMRFWGDGYGTWPKGSTPPSDTVSLDRITEDEGYDENMQVDIRNLKIGEAWTDHTHGPHSVVRVR